MSRCREKHALFISVRKFANFERLACKNGQAEEMPRTVDMQETRRQLEWSDLAIILAIGRT